MNIVFQDSYKVPSFLKHITSVSGDRAKLIFGGIF